MRDRPAPLGEVRVRHHRRLGGKPDEELVDDRPVALASGEARIGAEPGEREGVRNGGVGAQAVHPAPPLDEPRARARVVPASREHLRYVEDAVLGDGVLVELHGGRERDLGHEASAAEQVYRG